jgi:hypothetical protein
MAHEEVNPFSIMAIVGHRDTATAKRYTNPTDEQLLAAMGKISMKKSQHPTIDNNLGLSHNVKNQVHIGS